MSPCTVVRDLLPVRAQASAGHRFQRPGRRRAAPVPAKRAPPQPRLALTLYAGHASFICSEQAGSSSWPLPLERGVQRAAAGERHGHGRPSPRASHASFVVRLCPVAVFCVGILVLSGGHGHATRPGHNRLSRRSEVEEKQKKMRDSPGGGAGRRSGGRVGTVARWRARRPEQRGERKEGLLHVVGL